MPEIRKKQIGAVILSAGRSTRQNGFKPALPIGPHTVLVHCLNLFSAAGLDKIAVVLGHRGSELLPDVRAAGALPVMNPDYEKGMFSSVQAGVAALPADVRAFFVLPVDIPLVRRVTIEVLCRGLAGDPNADVLVPVFQGRTGHPPLIRDRLCEAIACHDGSRGLRGVLDKASVSQVTVPDRHVLVDIDTPEQYEKAKDLWQRQGIPNPEEAEVLLDWAAGKGSAVAAHSRAVARMAESLAAAVNQGGAGRLDRGLVTAGALLHDIAKGEPDHAAKGAGLLKAWGFADTLADIVACHADWEPGAGEPVGEIEIVYLADKLIRGDRPAPLDSRFEAKYHKFSDNPAARAGVYRRWRQARGICERVEAAMGRSVDEFL